MIETTTLPGPCVLCRSTSGLATVRGSVCAVCGWRFGDAVDPDLPLPRIDVVYYLRWDDRIKIGTTANPRQRLAVIWHQELLAFEPGDRRVEQARHATFASARLGGEWFDATPDLLSHAALLRGDEDPWHRYARWFSEALSAITG